MPPSSARAAVLPRVCVVGSGTRFISGISYYTYFLAEALSERYEMSVVLMRNLVPRRLYPGRSRVGAPITDLHASQVCPTFDGIDWHLVPSLARAGTFLRSQRPDVVVFQWWTGAVLPSFLYLQWLAHRIGANVILEFHEDQDTGESALPLVERIVRPCLRHLIGKSDHFVVHSEWDKVRLCAKFGLAATAVSVVPHGPYAMGNLSGDLEPGDATPRVEVFEDVITVLFFGTIRPYKGLEDLIDAFDLLPRDDGKKWKLLVVGETWEGWELPAQKIAASPFCRDIEFVNRYIADKEISGYFDRADIVALPYHRSSASGPLHVSMQRGLPVVVTDVGGLTEAAEGYAGTVFAPPRDPVALAGSIMAAVDLCDVQHVDPQTWDRTRHLFGIAIDGLIASGGATGKRRR